MQSSPEFTQQNPDTYRCLEIFYEKAQLTQQRLSGVNADEEAATIRDSEVDELNEMYPYTGMEVLTAGNGIFPTADEDGTIDGLCRGEVAHAQGLHAGLYIVNVPDAEEQPHYKLMHKIWVGSSESQPSVLLDVAIHIHHLLELDAVIYPVQEIDQLFSPGKATEEDSQEKLDLIYQESLGFIALLRSTRFRRLNRRQQQRTIDQKLIEVDQQIGVKGLSVMAEPVYAYTPLLVDEKQVFVPLLTNRQLLAGECMGLDSIEAARIRTKAIRRDQNLGDKEAGLCVVIDPDESTRSQLRLTDAQVLYVPTASQSFEMVLFGD